MPNSMCFIDLGVGDTPNWSVRLLKAADDLFLLRARPMEEYFNAQQLCVYAVIAIWIWTKRLMFSLLASVHFLDLPAEFGFKVQTGRASCRDRECMDV